MCDVFFLTDFLPARVRGGLHCTMLVLERFETLNGIVYKPLPLSLQTMCTAEDVMRFMQKHVAMDGSVDGLHIEFEGSRVHITNAEQLPIIAQLAAAHNNALIKENFKYEKGLDGQPYDDSELKKNDKNVYTNTMHQKTGKLPKTAASTPWDEEMQGDRFVFDSNYEQHENLLPWLDRRRDEQFGWYT